MFFEKFQSIGHYALKIKNDPVAISLIFVNLMTICFALGYQWSFRELFAITFIQALIIGFFSFLGILINPKFVLQKSDALTVAGDWMRRIGFEEINDFIRLKYLLGEWGRLKSSFFFIFLYLFILGVLFVFGSLFFIMPFGQMDVKYLFFVAGVFFIQHLISFLVFLPQRTRLIAGYDAKEFFEEPFLRVTPIYLISICSVFLPFIIESQKDFLAYSQIFVLILLLFNLVFDVKAHVDKHSREQVYELMRSKK